MKTFKSYGGVWFRRVPTDWAGIDWVRTDLPLSMLTDSNVHLAVLWLEGRGRGIAIRTADLIAAFDLHHSRSNNIVPFSLKFEDGNDTATVNGCTIPIFWW